MHLAPLREFGARSIKKRGVDIGGVFEEGIPGESPRPRWRRRRTVSASMMFWIAVLDEVIVKDRSTDFLENGVAIGDESGFSMNSLNARYVGRRERRGATYIICSRLRHSLQHLLSQPRVEAVHRLGLQAVNLVISLSQIHLQKLKLL